MSRSFARPRLAGELHRPHRLHRRGLRVRQRQLARSRGRRLLGRRGRDAREGGALDSGASPSRCDRPHPLPKTTDTCPWAVSGLGMRYRADLCDIVDPVAARQQGQNPRSPPIPPERWTRAWVREFRWKGEHQATSSMEAPSPLVSIFKPALRGLEGWAQLTGMFAYFGPARVGLIDPVNSQNVA